MSKKITVIPTRDVVRSLHWDGDDLVDWVNGDIHYLDGVTPQKTYNSYKHYSRFNSAVVSLSGRFKVIYEKLDTKGLIMDGSEIIREINRSYYQADVYEYPVVLFQLQDGREVIAHCPDEYNKLEIDELETGKRLTPRDGEPKDFFYSRLSASEDGKYLLSAGWIWHPMDFVQAFDVKLVLQNPSLLDEWSALVDSSQENNSACFLDNKRVVVCGSEDGCYKTEKEDEKKFVQPPTTIDIFDLEAKTASEGVLTTAQIGTMFSLDDKHVLGVYEYPKVVNLETGEVVQEWPQLKTGKQNSSIIHCIEKIPPMAWDKANRRFAVADEKNIHVLTIPRYDR